MTVKSSTGDLLLNLCSGCARKLGVRYKKVGKKGQGSSRAIVP